MDFLRSLCVLLCLGSFGLTMTAAAESATDPAATKYDLKYKFHRGESVRTETVHRAAVDTTVAGTKQTAETLSKSVKVWKILSVADNGNITFQYSVESVNMRHKLSGRAEVTYDSESDEKAPAGYEDVAKSVGVPLTDVTIDTRGKIIERQEKLGRPNQDQTGPMLVPLPTEPVSVGYSWSLPLDLDVAIDGGSRRIKCRQRYELADVKSGVATIQLETQLLTPTEDPKIRAQLAQRLSKGTIRFDVDSGRLLSQQMDWDERVIGFSGPDSSMHYLAQFTEQLLPAAKTAARPTLQE